VPPGWLRSGGDLEAVNALPAERAWVDGFVIRRHPVTNREYIAFLDDLVAAGREDEALRWAPRERAGQRGERGALIYGRGTDGRFRLRPDADGDLWDLDWPVLMIDYGCAAAYCRWLAARAGLPWRLPAEAEWEKAARGVDGRVYPWGDFFDPSWCAVGSARAMLFSPARVQDYPEDVSPYGVRGMAGNVGDWCADPALGEPDMAEGSQQLAPGADARRMMRYGRGGAWCTAPRSARLGFRDHYVVYNRSATLGVRPARSV